MVIDDKLFMTVRAMILSLNYAYDARMLLTVMYGDRHVPEFDFGRDDAGSVHLNIYMEDKECCRIKRIILCEDLLSAKDPVNVIYKELEEMRELLMSYEEEEVPNDTNETV